MADAVALPDPLLQFFRYEHLPVRLAAVSRPFCDLATGSSRPCRAIRSARPHCGSCWKRRTAPCAPNCSRADAVAEILSYSRPGPGAVGTEHLTFQADFDGHGSCLCRWGHLMVNGNRVSPGDLIRVLIDPACPVHRSHVVLMADLKRQAPGIELVEPFVGRYCECTDGRHRS